MYFVIFWIEYLVLYMYMRSFVKKNLFVDLFSLVLIEFPIFTACRICIQAVVVHEMHWKRVGSAGNAKEWATTHFRVSVTIENSDSMSQ